MRIIALLLVCLSLAAYRGYKTDSPPVPVAAANLSEQTSDVLFQSADNGKTWQDVSLGLPKKLTINCVYTQDGEIYLGTEKGLYHSRNPEKGVWENESFGEMVTNEFGLVLLNQRITGIFYGRSGPYAVVAGSGFFRKAPGTNTWQPMHEALPEKSINAVVENPDGTIFVGCSKGIYKSKDDGKTWQQVYSSGWVTSLVAEDGVLVGSASQGLVRSTDGGENWICVLTDENAVYKTSTIDGQFAAVRMFGSLRSGEAIPLRTSADGGLTWQRIDGDQLPKQRMYDLEKVGNYLFCSHKEGISRSMDGGLTWELVRPAAETREPLHIKLAVSGRTVFAVKVWEGC